MSSWLCLTAKSKFSSSDEDVAASVRESSDGTIRSRYRSERAANQDVNVGSQVVHRTEAQRKEDQNATRLMHCSGLIHRSRSKHLRKEFKSKCICLCWMVHSLITQQLLWVVPSCDSNAESKAPETWKLKCVHVRLFTSSSSSCSDCLFLRVCERAFGLFLSACLRAGGGMGWLVWHLNISVTHVPTNTKKKCSCICNQIVAHLQLSWSALAFNDVHIDATIRLLSNTCMYTLMTRSVFIKHVCAHSSFSPVIAETARRPNASCESTSAADTDVPGAIMLSPYALYQKWRNLQWSYCKLRWQWNKRQKRSWRNHAFTMYLLARNVRDCT